MTYDTVQKAVQDNEGAKEDFRGQLANISASINAMGSTFKGKAGRSFISYWEGTGQRHSEAIIKHIEKLDKQLQDIQKLVEDNDDQCASLFQYGL